MQKKKQINWARKMKYLHQLGRKSLHFNVGDCSEAFFTTHLFEKQQYTQTEGGLRPFITTDQTSVSAANLQDSMTVSHIKAYLSDELKVNKKFKCSIFFGFLEKMSVILCSIAAIHPVVI